MYIENLRIEHFGQLSDARADGLHRQLSILWCSRDSERDDAREFLRWLLFGSTNAPHWESGMHGANAVRACGSMYVHQGEHRHQVSRLNDGTRYGRLSIDGPCDDLKRDVTFHLGRITPHEFDVVFAPRLDLDLHPDQLLNAVRSANLDMSPRRIPCERRRRLTARLEQLRMECDRLPWNDGAAHLLERRGVLTRRIEQATQQQQRRRQDLDNEYRDLSQRIEQIRKEIDCQRREYQACDHEVKQRRHELEEAWDITQRAKESFLRQRREELAELETRTNRWQGILHEVQQRLVDVDDQLRHRSQAIEQPSEPACLVAGLADRLDRLRSDVANRIDAPLCPDGSLRETDAYHPAARQDTRMALDDLRREVSRLCHTLQDQRQSDKERWLESEVDSLRQCETVMTSWLTKLQEQRDQLQRELSDAEHTGLTLVDDGDDVDQRPYVADYTYGDGQRVRDPYAGQPYGDGDSYDDHSIARRTASRGRFIHAVAHSCDGYDIAHPDADSLLRELIDHRDAIGRELEERRRTADSLVTQRNDIDGWIARLDNGELDDIRRELAEIESSLGAAEQRERLTREIAHIQEELRYEKDPLQPSPVVVEASRILHQLTQGRFNRVRIDASQHVTVDDARGSAVDLRVVARELRGDVYLALCLALVAAYHREGIKLPLVMLDPFLLTNAGHAATRAAVIRDFARAGHQVMLLTSRRRVADLFRGFDFTFVELQPGRDVRPLPLSSPEPLPERRITEPLPEPLPERRITEPEHDGEFEDHVRFKRRTRSAQPDSEPVEHAAASLTPMNSTPSETKFATNSEEFVSRHDEPANTRGSGGKTPRVAATLSEETHSLSLTSSIGATDVVNVEVAAWLKEGEIKSVRDFLELNAQDVIEDLTQAGFASCPIRRWQDELALRCWVVGLTAEDASLLVACGISDVERLAEMESDQLYDFLTRSMKSQQKTGDGAERFEKLRDRTHFWVRAARRSRTDWIRFRTRTYGKLRWRRRTPPHESDSSKSSPKSPASGGARISGSSRGSDSSRGTPLTSPPSPSRLSRQTTRIGVPTSLSTDPATERTSPGQKSLKFLLNSSDPLADAPSIGPRTVAHFQKIGVHSVAEFLRLNPENAAAQIDNRRIKTDTIRQWQQQAILACRIPGLRAHDAQILVGCGIKDPTELARMEPAELWASVKPFVKTAEGKRIIRNGKTPDLREIEDWISMAQKSRTMKAA